MGSRILDKYYIYKKNHMGKIRWKFCHKSDISRSCIPLTIQSDFNGQFRGNAETWSHSAKFQCKSSESISQISVLTQLGKQRWVYKGK